MQLDSCSADTGPFSNNILSSAYYYDRECSSQDDKTSIMATYHSTKTTAGVVEVGTYQNQFCLGTPVSSKIYPLNQCTNGTYIGMYFWGLVQADRQIRAAMHLHFVRRY